MAVTGLCGIRAPGKYNGVVIFDRWDACHLYAGAYVMEISAKVKETLRAFAGQAMLIDAKEVIQPINPGDGLITKLQVLGPAKEPDGGRFGRPYVVEGLSLRVIANFGASNDSGFIVELRNTSPNRREIDTNSLAPTLLAKKQGLECFVPSDDLSYVAVTRTNIEFMHSNQAGGTCLINGKGRTVKLFLSPGVAISSRFDLDPGQQIEVPLRFELSPGEYQFLAGYGGGVHETRALASNLVSFDVDDAGIPHLVGGAGVGEPARHERRVGTVCGSVSLEDGTAASNAKVLLWPSPKAKSEPRAASTTLTNATGEFRMESVLEGEYAVSAIQVSTHSVLSGVLGDQRFVDAKLFSLPRFPEDCSLRFKIRPQPTFTIRGWTQPANPATGPRTVRLILKRGEAYPFEATTTVQAGGFYEFRDIPQGRYQFFAGWTGGGFDVTSDIDDLQIDIRWPDPEPKPN